jgi:hypothetical protein
MSCRSAYSRVTWKLENLTPDNIEKGKVFVSDDFTMKFGKEELKW